MTAATHANDALLRRLGVAPQDPRTHLLLALADDDLVTGHVASRLAATKPDDPNGPQLATLGTALLQQASVWLSRLAPAGPGQGAAIAQLALGRPAVGYTHAVSCEVRPSSFAHTLTRHWLHEHAFAVRLVSLTDSSDDVVASTARDLLAARRTHLDHATTWVARFASEDGGVAMLLRGLVDEFRSAFELFEEITGEADAVATGLLPLPHAILLRQWLELMAPAAEALGLEAGIPEGLTAPDWDGALDLVPMEAGRKGEHTEVWTDQLWTELHERI